MKYAALIFTLGVPTYFITTHILNTYHSASNEELGIEDGANSLEIAPALPDDYYSHKVRSQSTISNELTQLGVDHATIHQIVEAAKPHFDLGRISAGTPFHTDFDASNKLIGLKFKFSPIDKLQMDLVDQAWRVEKITETVDTKMVTFIGSVTSTLWESAEAAKMDPNLISELAEIFAWQIDFSREVRINDRWRISVEQKFVKSEPIGWGSILAAEYENAGQVFSATRFEVDGKVLGYFAPDGTNLKKMFLKSPIKYGRISSRFKMKRFHPILNVNRPHLGVDYAAPRGTPIRAVGAGTVTMSKWNGGGGNTIKIRHNSTYSTAYLHLSGFAKGIRSGAKVEQGQTIGYVGSTGLSTGPHLHFEFFHNGRYVDPLGQKFPSAEPVPAAHMALFNAKKSELMASLPKWEDVDVTYYPAQKSEKLQ